MSRPTHLTQINSFIDGSSALAFELAPADPNELLEAERPHLSLVPPLDETEPPLAQFVDAEVVPELSEIRAQAAQEFAHILSHKRDLLSNGEGEKVNSQIDALGTAKYAVDAKRRFGKDSPEYREKRAATRLDSARLIYEAASKNRPEYFEELLRTLDHGHYYSNGMSLSENVANGITPKANPEEVGRQGKELIEERTYEGIGSMIGRVGLQGMVEHLERFLPTTENKAAISLDVTTISMCADYAIESYKANPKGSHGGYSASPDVLKLMIRRTHFRDNSGNRYDEVAAVKGKYFDVELVNEVFAETTVMAAEPDLSKTDILGTQRIGINSGSVHEAVRLLDERGGAKHGVNLFYGEVVPADHPKDYAAFEAETLARQKKLEPMPDKLADFLESLVEANVASDVANNKVDHFLKGKLLELSTAQPELAAAIFDERTAQGFRDVAKLRDAGHLIEAQRLLDSVKESAPDLVYCGGGGWSGGGGSWWAEEMKKLGQALGKQMNEQELIEKYGKDKRGALAFYCGGCGTLNERNDPKRKKKDGTYRSVKTCKGCQKDVSCGDPDAM